MRSSDREERSFPSSGPAPPGGLPSAAGAGAGAGPDPRPAGPIGRRRHEPAPERSPAQSGALAPAFRADPVRRALREPRSARAALRAVDPGHRAAGVPAQPRDGVGVRQDRRRRGRTAQRDVGEPDRAGHRAGRASRRAAHPREIVHRGSHRDQRAVHAGRVVPPGGLRHHVQEYNKSGARLQAGLLFLATIALLAPGR
jgi:hypothetical protein